MKSSFFKKLFISLLAFTSICLGLTIVFASFAERNHPDFVSSIMERMGQKMGEGKDYEETAEEDLHQVRRLKIANARSDLEIQTYEGSTLKVLYTGKVPKSLTEAQFIFTRTSGDEALVEIHTPESGKFFHIQWNDNDKGLNYSDVQLVGKIFIPRDFHGELEVQSASGDLDLSHLQLGHLVVKSVHGDVELNDSQIGQIKMDLVNGDLNSEGVAAGGWDLKNVSGDIDLSIPVGQLYRFELASVSGDIKNESGLEATPQTKDPGLIRIKTVSGDIKINKYYETKDDRE